MDKELKATLNDEQLERLADLIHQRMIDNPPPVTRWPFGDITVEDMKASVHFFLELRETLRTTRKTVLSVSITGFLGVLAMLIILGIIQKIKEAIGGP